MTSPDTTADIFACFKTRLVTNGILQSNAVISHNVQKQNRLRRTVRMGAKALAEQGRTARMVYQSLKMSVSNKVEESEEEESPTFVTRCLTDAIDHKSHPIVSQISGGVATQSMIRGLFGSQRMDARQLTGARLTQ